MNTTQMRNQLKEYIDQLSPNSLELVTDFLSNLLAQENPIDNLNNESESDINALELVGDLVGCIEASSDLSTNKDYLKGFGK